MKNKIYELIGRATVVLVCWTSLVAFVCWAFLQNTIY